MTKFNNIARLYLSKIVDYLIYGLLTNTPSSCFNWLIACPSASPSKGSGEPQDRRQQSTTVPELDEGLPRAKTRLQVLMYTLYR